MTKPCAQAPHPEPEHLRETFPPLAAMDDLAAALASGEAGCRQCMAAHRSAASQRPVYLHQAVSLFLVYTAIVLHAYDRDPGKTGEELVMALAPDTMKVLSPASVGLLRAIPLTMRAAPDGGEAATWDKHQLAELIEVMPVGSRAHVWNDVMGLLVGIAQGQARARAEAEG